MERLTSLANSNSQTVERLQSLEAQLVKLTTQKASLEEKERKAKEEASLVSTEVNDETLVSVFLFCFPLKQID